MPRRSSPASKLRRTIAILLTIIALGAGLIREWRSGSPAPPAPKTASSQTWQKLEGCTLSSNVWNDGDSFHVTYRGQDYIFRLYFVDTPESEGSLKERLADQGKYFGISAKEAQALGKEAAAFTHSQLKGREFTVYTRWRDALGRSKQPRYYAMVYVDGERDLAELLVAEGFARIYGTRVALPDGKDSRDYLARLHDIETKAKSRRRGGWRKNAR